MLPNPSWTLDEAVAHFDALIDQGKIPDRKSGGRRTVGAGERRVILNDVRNALARASGVENPGGVRLTPYLEVLLHFARVDAEEQGRSRPANRVSSVRTFLSIVEGRERRTTRRAIAASFLPAWVPLYEAVAGLENTNLSSRQPRHLRYPGYLYAFQNFLQRHGVSDPRVIPSYAQVLAWAEAEAKETGNEKWRKAVDNWLTAYRSGRDALGDPSLPALAASPIGLHRGLRGLDVSEQLRKAGCIALQADLSLREMVRTLAPQIAAAVDHYLEHAGKSRSWNEAVVTSASCLVAELIRIGMGDELAEMDLLEMYERRISVPVPASKEGAIPLLRRRLKNASGAATVSLLRKYVDEAARRSIRHSPMRPTTVVPDSEVPFYTTAIFNETTALWKVAEFVYGRAEGYPDEGMMAESPEEWARLRLEHQLVREHMKSTNALRKAEGHKAKRLITINWAQAVCVALPVLWKETRALREAYHLAYGKHEDLEAGAVQRARRQYFRALKRYMIAAVLLDDGLRVANYAGARAGQHFLPEVERCPDGSWRRIVGIRTYFRGYCQEAKLKISRDESGKERERERTLRPGIVDMELLSDYWLELRPRDLVACGMIQSAESYNPDADGFAFFVSPMSKRSGHGGYTPARLSKKFGRILHWMLRDALGRDVPAWREIREDKALRWKWRGLFGAHATRLLIATYWGVVREKWSVARELTNDKVSTLQSYYGVFEGWIAECRTRQGVEHPDHFEALADRLRNGEVIDWATFDPQRPQDAETVARSRPVSQRRTA